MTLRKYSKSSSFYLNTKKNFFENNKEMLNKVTEQNLIYTKQIRRKKCKICLFNLGNSPDFKNHEVEYIFCQNCNHLNGIYEDTKTFIEKMYIEDKGTQYSLNYIDSNFKTRSEQIYLPKVKFLLKNIPTQTSSILDIGCGGGHFVFAGLTQNCDIYGIDVNKQLINFGNNQIYNLLKFNNRLSFKSESEMFKTIINSKAEILSAMGVIEHLRYPHKLFQAFRKSKIKYLYYSVPMFSMSALLENAFKKVFPRQLSGGHTHLYTEESIVKMNEIIGIESIAEWRFGTDAMDLFRSLLVTMNANKVSNNTTKFFSGKFIKVLDKFQKLLDKNHFCSEIHLLGCKK